MALTARSHSFFQGLSDESVELSAKLHASFMFSCRAPSQFLTWPPLVPPPALLEAYTGLSGASMCPSSGTRPHLNIYHMLRVFPGGQGPYLIHHTRVWHKVGQVFVGLNSMSKGNTPNNALDGSGHIVVSQPRVSVN